MKKLLLTMACLILVVCTLVACGDSSKPQDQPQAHVHSYTEWTTTKAPTCTEEGIKERDCSCGDIQTSSIPTTEHVLSWTTTKEATCTVDGTKEGVCSCGYSQTSSLPASGHSFGSWTTTKAVTCTVDGAEERVCSCGEKETRTVAGSHSWVAATCVKAKTCTKCHATEGSALGHTCDVGTCTRCNTKIEPKIHLPNTPMTAASWNGLMKITGLSYHFNNGDLVLSFTGEITKGDGMHACTITVYDKDGYVVTSEAFHVFYLNVGDKFKDKTITIYKNKLNGSSEYRIKISDYN